MDGINRALLVGASRGVGLGLARELSGRGWDVVATSRGASPGLVSLGAESQGRLHIETLELTDPVALQALDDKLAGRVFDLVFVIAGIGGPTGPAVHEASAEAASRMFITNATAPVQVAEAFADQVAPGGVVAFMSSGLGSIALAGGGGNDLYRASKAALNMMAQCFSARHPGLAVRCIAPGWVRTDMGGPAAPLDVQTSMHGVADALEASRGHAGAAFLNWKGETLPW